MAMGYVDLYRRLLSGDRGVPPPAADAELRSP